MKCLIPVEQEQIPKNAIKRAKICDEIILLYIVEKHLMERMKSESSYILPSSAIEEMEKMVIELQKKEAQKIADELGKNVNLKFVIGEYYESIDKEIVVSAPDLLMSDSYKRGLLGMNVPIWIDRGTEIKEATFVVYSLSKLKKIQRDFHLAYDICARLNAKLYIHYTQGDDYGSKTLKELGPLISSMSGELLFLQKGTGKVPVGVNVMLL